MTASTAQAQLIEGLNTDLQGEAAQEFGLAAELDSVIADETRHRDELRQMLARWP